MRIPKLVASATAVAGVLLLPACSTGVAAGNHGDVNGARQDVSAPVRDAVTKAMAVKASWTGPTDSVHVPEGKRIVSITCSSQGIGCVNAAAGAKEAGKFLGWNVSVVDGKGDPNTWNAAVAQAVSDGADGIILNAINPALVQDGLTQARAKRIPIVLTFIPSYGGPKVDAYVTSDHAQSGQQAADWIIADSGAKGHVLLLQEPQFPELNERTNAAAKRLSDACSRCPITRKVQFNIGTMPQQLPGLVSSALQSDTGINYVLAPFDSASLFASQGITQSGRAGVRLVGFEGDPDGIKRVRSGAQAADVATVQPWMGWAAIDALARLMTGQKVQQQQVPQRLFDKTNAPSGGDGWVGDLDFRARYRQLWGK